MARIRQSVPRRVVAVLLASSISVVLVGCSATNPITSLKPYAPSDGVRATIGDVTAENLFVLTSGVGEVAALQGAFTNRGSERVTVSVTGSDGSVAGTVPVAAGETVLLGGDGDVVELVAADPPGAVTALTLETGPGGTTTLSVPVLDGTLPEYATNVPTADPTRG